MDEIQVRFDFVQKKLCNIIYSVYTNDRDINAEFKIVLYSYLIVSTGRVSVLFTLKNATLTELDRYPW